MTSFEMKENAKQMLNNGSSLMDVFKTVKLSASSLHDGGIGFYYQRPADWFDHAAVALLTHSMMELIESGKKEVTLFDCYQKAVLLCDTEKPFCSWSKAQKNGVISTMQTSFLKR